VVVPMMSGRGLGHTAGTLDKLESIPGFRVGLSLDEFRTILREVGCALIGQTKDIAPADRKLYALRDVTATVESIPLITASILSKKVAEGIEGLVMDVKCGRGAFMKTREDARRLAESLVTIGNAQGVRTEALITSMEVPLGRMVGNGIEVIEAIETLKGRGPADLESLSVKLASRMLVLGGVASEADAEQKIRSALKSGRGVELFRTIIEKQGGDPRVIDDYSLLPQPTHRRLVTALHSGCVADLHAELISRATMVLGAGRERVSDTVDHSVGARILVHVGERVKAGEPILELQYRDGSKLDTALALLDGAIRIADSLPSPPPLVLEEIRA
jgi:pyrimidine-nucleoside phosphorylase